MTTETKKNQIRIALYAIIAAPCILNAYPVVSQVTDNCPFAAKEVCSNDFLHSNLIETDKKSPADISSECPFLDPEVCKTGSKVLEPIQQGDIADQALNRLLPKGSAQ